MDEPVDGEVAVELEQVVVHGERKEITDSAGRQGPFPAVSYRPGGVSRGARPRWPGSGATDSKQTCPPPSRQTVI